MKVLTQLFANIIKYISSKKKQSIGIFYAEGIFYLRSSFIIYQLLLIVFYFDNERIIGKRHSVTFEKLTITLSDLNANINISHFKPKILEAHLKDISHKHPDVDSIFDFITRTTASNITKAVLADIITGLVKQNIIINKKSIRARIV